MLLDLQDWLSPSGRVTLAYKTEEIMTTDPVVIVPKPAAKEPEEIQDLCIAQGAQLELPQCQLSYVGLPVIQEAPLSLPMVCPGSMSYTKLPCSIWGGGIGKEKEIDVTSPEVDLNISLADSGCACKDLTQSPECSVGNSPVDESPPVCICTDYCILNKTAEGFAPVLASKESIQNAQSDSLQEDLSPK